MRQLLDVLTFILHRFLSYRDEANREKRRKAIDDNARAEWERRFGGMRQPNSTELEYLRSELAKSGDDTDRARDVDK